MRNPKATSLCSFIELVRGVTVLLGLAGCASRGAKSVADAGEDARVVAADGGVVANAGDGGGGRGGDGAAVSGSGAGTGAQPSPQDASAPASDASDSGQAATGGGSGGSVDAGGSGGNAGAGGDANAGAGGDANAGAGGDANAGAGGAGMQAPLDPRDPAEPIATQSVASFGLPAELQNAPGDLILSETGRGCLAVSRTAALSPGAAIVIETCRGLPGQRWDLGTGTPKLADDPTLCIDASGQTLRLALCASLTTNFVLASDGVIERGTKAIDLTSSNEVIAYSTHRGTNQRWTLLSKDLELLQSQAGYNISYPLAASDSLAYSLELARHRVGSVQPPYPVVAATDVANFPGLVPNEAPRISRRVHLNRRFDHATDYLRVSWPAQHWQSTGVYAAPGETLVIVVPETAQPGLSVIINTHTDALAPDSSNVAGKSFARMPRVSLRIALEPGINAVRSQYGGEVVLKSDRDSAEVLQIDIHGGVELPRFVLGVTSDQEWARRRALQAPWAELEGDRAVITVPSDQIRNLARPAEVMARYDGVVALEADLFGLDPALTTGVHRMYAGKARFVADVQITAGSGHSGFPIMTMLDWNLADQDAGGDGWGVWHELGHNHQQFCLWSTRFGTESSVNLFSLYVQDRLHATSRIADRYAPVVVLLEAGSLTFGSADVWQKLVFLMQPVLAFPERGFDLYRQVHRAYRELADAERSSVCADSALQVDTFYKLLSRAAGADLRDHFTRWGFSLSAEVQASVAGEGLTEPSTAVWRATPQ